MKAEMAPVKFDLADAETHRNCSGCGETWRLGMRKARFKPMPQKALSIKEVSIQKQSQDVEVKACFLDQVQERRLAGNV